MASQVVAKVVVIELPDNQWPEPLNFLLSHHRIFSIDTRQAVFDAVGYLCEEVSSGDIHQGQLHELLSFAYRGMCYDRRNTDIVKLAAIRAVCNLLPFAHTMLSDSFESSDIVELACEAALSSEVKIRQTALECLVYIAAYFHSERVPELEEIFDITTKAVKEDEEPVAIQAIGLWSTICCKGIVLEDIDKQLLCNLVPVLLETLLKQEEDQDQVEDSSKLAVAGRICLGHVARAIGDDIFPLVMPFIEENITKPDWRQRNAAEKALLLIQGGLSSDKRRLMFNIGCGSTPCTLMEDFNSHSKDYSAWALGQEFKHIEF